MKSKSIRNLLIIQIYIFVNLLKNYFSQNYKVTSVDPPSIKINENQKTQSIVLITLMFDEKHEFNLTEKINKEIILIVYNNKYNFYFYNNINHNFIFISS